VRVIANGSVSETRFRINSMELLVKVFHATFKQIATKPGNHKQNLYKPYLGTKHTVQPPVKNKLF
jgi:hypothetical protein